MSFILVYLIGAVISFILGNVFIAMTEDEEEYLEYSFTEILGIIFLFLTSWFGVISVLCVIIIMLFDKYGYIFSNIIKKCKIRLKNPFYKR